MDEGNMQSNVRFCTNCGSPITEGQVFCTNCGFKLVQPQKMPVQNEWQQPQEMQPQNNWQQSQVEEQVAEQPMEELPTVELPVEEEPIVIQPQDVWQQPQQPQQPIQEQAQQTNYNPYYQQPAGMYNQPDNQSQQGQQYSNNSYYQGNENGQPVAPTNAFNPAEPKKPMDPKKKKKRIILFSCIGAAFIALVVVGIVLLNYFSYTKLNAKDLCKVTYEGVNSKGRIVLSLDTNNEDYKKAYKDAIYKDKDLKTAFLLESIRFEADHENDLSNGDTIHIKTVFKEEKLKDKKIKLTNTEFDTTVEGLPEADLYDLFKDVALIFNGVNGYGSVDLDTSACDDFATSYVRYSITSDTSNLKNGDTVTVEASVDEDDLTDNGYTTDVFSKTYTVEGLQEVQSYDVFKDIKLVYEGSAPNLTVSVDNTACEEIVRDYVYFRIDDYSNKKNGDTVVVYADFDADYLRSKGYDITTTSKSFTVEGQSEMLAAADDVVIKQMDNTLSGLMETWMKSNGDGYIYEFDIVNEIGAGYKLGDAKNEIVNRYFGVKNDADPYNLYAIITKCSYTVSNKETKDTQQRDLYVMAMVTNVTKGADGTYTGTEPEAYLCSEDINKIIEELNNTGYTLTEVKGSK